jgi:hypothetical protein
MERGEPLNGLYERIHLLGGAAVLAQSIAEAKLIEPLVHLDQRAGDRRGLREQVHDHQQPRNAAIGAESVDGVAERRVVDDAAVPIVMHFAVASADVGPGKLRRNAAACQDVVWLDRGWLGVADFLIGEPVSARRFPHPPR